MPSRRQTSASLTEFGFTAAVEDLYWQLHGRDGELLERAAHVLGFTVEALLEAVAPLQRIGAVVIEEGVVRVPSRPHVLAGLLEAEMARIEASGRRVRELAGALPALMAPQMDIPDGGSSLSGFVSENLDPPATMARWIEESTGDLLMMRPDQWRMPQRPELVDAHRRALEAGRVCRALYPARALDEAADVLQARARLGEQVRVLARVPTRIFVIPATHALVPAMPGYETSRLLAIHERGVVLLLAQFFERLWEQAVPCPDSTSGVRAARVADCSCSRWSPVTPMSRSPARSASACGPYAGGSRS